MDDVPHSDQPETSAASIARSQSADVASTTPKKGILKRSSLRTDADKKNEFPARSYRESPDRFPEKGPSRIPKLSVTWWEKNAVAVFGDTSDENNTDSEQVLKDLGSGPRMSRLPQNIRQTAILDSEEDSEEPVGLRRESAEMTIATNGDAEPEDAEAEGEDDPRDDAMSVASSGSATSSIVGRWWTGKDTRYVLHCDKKGCNHRNHHKNPSDYLTPTQRRNKEINELKKELRDVLNDRDEKDRHLLELRERIKEVEMMNDVQSALAHSQKLMQQERETREHYEKEKKAAEKRHAIRVNQLVQETLAAREEISRLNQRIEDLEEQLNKATAEASTMTDFIESTTTTTSAGPQSPTLAPVDPGFSQVTIETEPPSSSPTATDNPLSPARSAPDQIFRPTSLPFTSPLSISMDSKLSGQPMYMSQEAVNQMQAYQNEAYIWRTKAAQLEIVLKDQLLKSSALEQRLKVYEITGKDSSSSQDLPPPHASPAPEAAPAVAPVMQDSGIDYLSPGGSPQHKSGECVDSACTERKRSLIDENNRLLSTIDEMTTRIRELEEDVSSLRGDCDKLENEKEAIKQKIDAANKDIESKDAEIAACNIVINRLQTERETMQKAITYMEERMQVYQHTLMEHDLIVSDENTANWRKGFSDPRYAVMLSKRVQTMLTAQDLSEHEDEFQSTKRKLEELHNEFAANRSDLKGRFEEIENILEAKKQLVEALTKQLEDARRDQRTAIDEHQRERDQYKTSLAEMAAIAERVPGLETKIEELTKENAEMELRFKEQREEFENGLADSLDESMKKYKEQSDYWKQKMHVMEQQLERAKKEAEGLLKEKEDLRIKAKLDRVDLEQRLTSSIDHVALLNQQVNKDRRDVECEAKPRQVSKYVACRPNVKSKSTLIEKGDLFDESEERLKLCQGELATTRRQVHVLQQKLIGTVQERVSKRLENVQNASRRRIACVVERPMSADGRREDNAELLALKTKNAELRERLSRIDDEKQALVMQERDRIQHLAAEFDNVRKELDQEMSRYESEKRWLKSRIRNLEKDNEELQKQIEKSSSSASEAIAGVPTISVDDSRELEKVRESLKRTASAASAASTRSSRSQLSPAFGSLADELLSVKSNLEKILSDMEEDDRQRTPVARRSRSPGAATIMAEQSLQAEIDELEQVVASWDTDAKEQLTEDLAKCRAERDELQKKSDRLASELATARAELLVYHTERPTASATDPSDPVPSGRLVKSRSVVNLDTIDCDREEAKRWKLKCGTMFRELNTMRSGYAKAMAERRDLKIQLAMLRGELELAKMGNAVPRTMSMSSSAYFSPVGTSKGYQTANEEIVHESPAPFRRGSRHESIVATIPSTSARTRSASARRRDDYNAMEERRTHRQSRYATAPQTPSSSTTSLYQTAITAKPPLQPPAMSQSWHEASTSKASLVEQEGERKSTVRVVSLREKVSRLTRENALLYEKLDEMKSKNVRVDDHERLNRLEAEKEVLKEQVEMLLRRIQQDDEVDVPSVSARIYLEEQLAMSRRENEMYEKKLEEMEEERRDMYLTMFQKGQQAATMDIIETKQLDQMTQDRVTLKFLHDAFYYYLMNKGDSKKHLQAIMTMLDFTREQKDDVSRRRGKSH